MYRSFWDTLYFLHFADRGSGDSRIISFVILTSVMFCSFFKHCMNFHNKQEKCQSDCSGGELSPQPHINNIGLCVHYMIYRIKLINNKVIQSNNINYVKCLG